MAKNKKERISAEALEEELSKAETSSDVQMVAYKASTLALIQGLKK